MNTDFRRGKIERILARHEALAHPWFGLAGSARFIDTEFLSANRLTQEKWSQTFFEWKLENMQLSKFMGPSDNNIIQVDKDLSKGPGDRITFHLIPPLSNSGGGDDSDIEGNEEAMSDFNFPLVVHERNNGVRSKGIMSEKRTAFKIRRDATTALGRWAAEQLDNDLIYALSGVGNQGTYAGEGTSDIETVNEKAPSSNRIIFGGQTAAGTVTLETSDSLIGDANGTDYLNYLFGSQMISIAKRAAQAASPKFRPIMIGGKGYYVMFLHRLQVKALRNETSAVNSWTAIQSAANVRGINNPMFTRDGSGKDRIFDGAVGVFDDVILFEYDRVLSRTGAQSFDDPNTAVNIVDANIVAGTSRIVRALLCGAQAGVVGWGQQWRRLERGFDYKRKPGTAIDGIMGISKTQFNDPGANQSANTAQQDFAVICLDTAAQDD